MSNPTTHRRTVAVSAVLLLAAFLASATPVVAAPAAAGIAWGDAVGFAWVDGLLGWLGLGAPAPAADAGATAELDSAHAAVGGYFDPDGYKNQSTAPGEPQQFDGSTTPN